MTAAIHGKKPVWREYVEAIVVSLALALLIRTFIVQAFKIPSSSMVPTLLVGDHLLVNKFVYRFRGPARGDIVVFKFPNDRKTDFIKRIVALGGDTIEMNGRTVPDQQETPARILRLLRARAVEGRLVRAGGRPGGHRLRHGRQPRQLL